MTTLAVALSVVRAPAQSTALTLQDAVQQALDRYPAVRSSLEQVSGAAAAIGLTRTTYLPRADMIWQENRATHNNVFGLMLPQSMLPQISGPALGTNSLSSVWGSAVGTLVTWEPFDFGLRKATVGIAETERDRGQAQVGVTKLQVGTAAADGFLTILAAQETVAAARSAVDRARVFDQTVEALVNNQLRPGADGARTRAELALAEAQLIRAEQSVDVSKAALAQLLGVPPQSLSTQPGPLLQVPPAETVVVYDPVRQIPPAETVVVYDPVRHPQAIAQLRAVDAVRAREEALDRSYYPRFFLQGTTYARGTSLRPNTPDRCSRG